MGRESRVGGSYQDKGSGASGDKVEGCAGVGAEQCRVQLGVSVFQCTVTHRRILGWSK